MNEHDDVELSCKTEKKYLVLLGDYETTIRL